MNILFELLITVFPLLSFSPATITTHTVYCASDVLHEERMDAAINYREQHEALEAAALAYFQSGIETTTPPDYILPVVVHIIHDDGAENISDMEVEQGLLNLNEAYGNINYYDQETGVDTRIQFCLAKRDPEGNMTTGINRIQSPLTEVNYEEEDLDLKDLIRWEPTKYINIWLVREICSAGGSGCNISGYAYYPAAHGSDVDGIVMEAALFGSSPSNSVVQVHEMGHYLGLYHTFEGGCENLFCLASGDRVCDTPPDQSIVAVPCEVAPNSCDTDVSLGDPANPFTEDQPDMKENYLDYGDLTCMSAFTQGQADRMHFFIENARVSLLNTNSCVDPCPEDLVANFTASAIDVNVGDNVIFTNNSTGANVYEWTINGNTFSTNEDASFLFSNEGTFTINLNILIDTLSFVCNEDFSIAINVVCPVEASYEASDFYPTPGDVVDFTNTSANALSYQWTVNNIPVAVTPDFSLPTPIAGNYTVCLTADNIVCDDEYCLTIIAEADLEPCDQTLITRIGTGEMEEGLEFLPHPDGGYFLTGRTGDNALLMRYDANDNQLWQRDFDFTKGGGDHFRQIIRDSEGMLVFVGRNQALGSDIEAFLMRYDPENDQVLWAKTMDFPSANRLERIQEAPNGNYITGGSIDPGPSSGLDWHLMEISKNTGNAVWQKTYSSIGNTDIITSLEIYDNKIYVSGPTRHGGGLNDIRSTLACFDLTGNIEWSNFHFNEIGDNARTYMNRFIIENDTIFGIHRGSTTSVPVEDHQAQFTMFDLDGNLLAAKQYDTANGSVFFGIRLIKLADGFLISGYYTLDTTGGINSFLMRTNYAGEVIWAKSIGEPTGIHFMFDIVLHQGVVYAIGRTNQVGDNTLFDITLLKIPINDPNFGESCDFITDLEIIESDVPDYVEYFTGTSVGVDYPLTTYTLESMPTNLLVEDICEAPCEEICNNGIDDDGDGLIDCCDPDLAEEDCCSSQPYLAFEEDTIFICDNGVMLLDAGEGFESYIWNDATTEQTLTTSGPGRYFVTVEDEACGIFSDTIDLIELPETIAEANPQFMSICPGDSVTISVSPDFDAYEWIPADYLNCDTCQTVIATPEEPIQYIVVAHFDNGCYSVDTVNIVIDGIQTSETITACTGEVVTIFGEPQTAPGAYAMTFVGSDGCDSTHTVNLENYPIPVFDLTLSMAFSCTNTCSNIIAFSSQEDIQIAFDGGLFTAPTTYVDLCPGTYTYQVKDAQGCLYDYSVEVLEIPPIVATIDPGAANIALGDSVQLEAILSPSVEIASIIWIPTTDLSCTDCPNPIATPSQSTTYEAAITDINGCAYTASIFIEVDNSCNLTAEDIASAFSPNNDDINDTFTYNSPEGLDARTQSLRIFNRWGDLVYEGNVDAAWNGMQNGKPAPSDVYVYVLEVICNGEVSLLQGDVTLLR